MFELNLKKTVFYGLNIYFRFFISKPYLKKFRSWNKLYSYLQKMYHYLKNNYKKFHFHNIKSLILTFNEADQLEVFIWF